jgi:N-6 DNA Methylase
MTPPPDPAVPHDADRGRAALVADAVIRAASAAGVAADRDLLVWSLAGRAGPAGPTAGGRSGGGAPGGDGAAAEPPDAAAVLGAALEAATDDDSRRARGLHVTPGWLADELVERALPDELVGRALPDAPSGPGGGRWPAVCDPACGGGAFLVAAARRLHRSGADRRHIVRHLLWGADIDAVGLAAAEAALSLWAGERPPSGRLVVADPLHAGAAAWPGPPPGGFDAVVGNPPFQSPLARATARSGDDRRRLRARFGPTVRAYTDTAWLFLLLGCELATPGGRIVLVQPQSVVAARDAEAVRGAVDARAILRDLWLDDGRVFAAAVRVCAPVLERRRQETPPGDAPAAEGWGRLWSRAVGVPRVDVTEGPTLGERASVVAGFRDQYYGLVDAVREHDPRDPAGAAAPLVTSGAIDWAGCGWGERPIRFAKRRWRAPVVDGRRLADAPPIAQRWVDRTRAPKLLVAAQTTVVEAAVDVGGTWVPSVPVLAVVPGDPADLWRLAAAVLAPAATAWLARRSAGTALDRGALKVAGPDLAALPLPADPDAWDKAAAALRAYVGRPTSAGLDAYLDAVAAAYGTPDAVTTWWRAQAGTAVRPPGSAH